MSANLFWGIVIGVVGLITWPIIKAILIFVLTLLTGIFGALTSAVGTIPDRPIQPVSLPAQSSPAQSGTGHQPPSADAKYIADALNARLEQSERKQGARDDKQDLVVAGVASEVKEIKDLVSKSAVPAPVPTARPPCNGCGRGEWLELPPAQ